MADEVDLGSVLEKYSVPERQASLTTFYYPATPEETRAAGLSYGTEGGTQGGGRFGDIDLRNHTLEKYREGKSPWVAVAMAGAPTGEHFRLNLPDGPVIARNVDTGGGLRPGQIDIATSIPDLARTGVYHGPVPATEPTPSGEVPRSKLPPVTEEEIDAIVGKPTEEKPKEKHPGTPAPQPEPIPIPSFETPQLPMEQIPAGPGLSDAIGVGQPIPGPAPTPDLFAGAVQEQIAQQTPQTLLAGPPTAASLQDVDLGAVLNKYAGPSPTPTPDVDLGAVLHKYTQPGELPTPQIGDPQHSFVKGLGQGLLETAKGLVPQSLEQAKDLAVMMAAPANREAFLRQAAQLGVADYAAAKAAIEGGPYEAGRAVGVIGPQVAALAGGMRAGNFRAGAAPPRRVASSAEAPATLTRPPVQTQPQAVGGALIRPSEIESEGGTSNRIFQEVYGEAAPVGHGANVDGIAIDAQNLINTGKLDPYNVLSQRAPGMASDIEYASLAIEHERLVNEAVRLEKEGSPFADEAARNANDFANAIQPHKTAASNRMRQMQGNLNYDVSTVFGMEQYMKAELDRAPTPQEKAKMTERAQGVRKAQKEAVDALADADRRVQRRYAKVPDITMDEASRIVHDWFKDCL